MEVTGTQDVKVMISGSEERRIAVQAIYDKFDINKFDMIDVENKNIVQWADERRGSMKEIRRPATDDDIAAFTVLSRLIK